MQTNYHISFILNYHMNAKMVQQILGACTASARRGGYLAHPKGNQLVPQLLGASNAVQVRDAAISRGMHTDLDGQRAQGVGHL